MKIARKESQDNHNGAQNTSRYSLSRRFVFINASHGFLTTSLLLNLVCLIVNLLISSQEKNEVDDGLLIILTHLRLEMRETKNTILCFITFIPLKSLLMGSYFSFVAIAILFPRKQTHCASPNSFFSPRWNSVSITKDFCKLICSARFPRLKILARVLPDTLLEFPSLCHSRPSPQLNWGGAAVRRLGFPARAWILLHVKC